MYDVAVDEEHDVELEKVNPANVKRKKEWILSLLCLMLWLRLVLFVWSRTVKRLYQNSKQKLPLIWVGVFCVYALSIVNCELWLLLSFSVSWLILHITADYYSLTHHSFFNTKLFISHRSEYYLLYHSIAPFSIPCSTSTL